MDFRNRYQKKSKYWHSQNSVVSNSKKVKAELANLLTLNKELKELGCWITAEKYARIKGVYLYSEFARGEGEVTRHLCRENRCINPLHLIKGSDLQNAMDEIDYRQFTVNYLSKELEEDYSGIDVSVAALVVVARYARKFTGENNSFNVVYAMIKEAYRKSVELRLYNRVVNSPDCNKIRSSLKDKLLRTINEYEFTIMRGVLDE